MEAGKDWRGVLGASGQCSDASKDWPGVVERRTGQARGADGKDLEMGSHLLLASPHSLTKKLSASQCDGSWDQHVC